MNNYDQWEETIALGLARGDLSAARKLMADPTPDRLADVSRLLHEVRKAIDGQKYPNGSWGQIMAELTQLVWQYEHS